jgi:hypothetical protein
MVRSQAPTIGRVGAKSSACIVRGMVLVSPFRFRLPVTWPCLVVTPCIREAESDCHAERREGLRWSFVAPAELIDIRSGVRIQARTSDLSFKGCYIDTLNPFPVSTSVRLRIYKGKEPFEVQANVISQHSESKITPLVLGWVDSVVRSDNPDFGVAGSFWQCAFVSIV